MSSLFRPIYICFFLLSSLGLSAQELSVQANLDRSEIKTGGQALINLSIRTSDLEHTRFYLSEEQPSRFEVLSFSPVDTIDLGASLKEIKAEMLITSFDSTLITIPPIIATLGDLRQETEPMALKVKQPEVDISRPDQIKDQKTSWILPYSFSDIVRIIYTSWIFYILLLLLLLLIGWRYYKKRRKQKLPLQAAVTIERSALEKALLALKALSVEELTLKEFYSSGIDILRHYIEEKKGWSVMEYTSEAMLTLFQKRGVSSWGVQRLSDLLFDADMVKFAKVSPTREEEEHFRGQLEELLIRLDEVWSLESKEEGAGL